MSGGGDAMNGIWLCGCAAKRKQTFGGEFSSSSLGSRNNEKLMGFYIFEANIFWKCLAIGLDICLYSGEEINLIFLNSFYSFNSFNTRNPRKSLAINRIEYENSANSMSK